MDPPIVSVGSAPSLLRGIPVPCPGAHDLHPLSSSHPRCPGATPAVLLAHVAVVLAACDGGASSTTVPGHDQPLRSSRIGNLVWYDKDRDGVQDPLEPGIPDVAVALFDTLGNSGLTRTDAAGRYQFEDLPEGEYFVVLVTPTLPKLAIPAPCNATGDDTLDNDCSPAMVVLPDGETDDATVDFGLTADFVAIGFETEDDLTTPLVNGQDLSLADEFGRMLGIEGFAGGGASAAIFDSDPNGPNAGSADPDLLVDRGNLLILQDDPRQTIPGVYDAPGDDARGGILRVVFPGSGAAVRSIDLVDVAWDDGQDVFVATRDVQGHCRNFVVRRGWTEDITVDGPPGHRTLDLTSFEMQDGYRTNAFPWSSHPDFDENAVRHLYVQFIGSGALDDIVFAPDLLDGVRVPP